MPNNPSKNRRRSIRLEGYDYSQRAGYFVTICVQDRGCIFGTIANGTMRMNTIGRIIEEEWLLTPGIRPTVELDRFVVMPNHVHGILYLLGDGGGAAQHPPESVGANGYSPLRRRPFESPSMTIGAILRGFKGASTKRVNQFRNTPGHRVWQRNYYEHIIRNEKELSRIQAYIIDNPLQWSNDPDNPLRTIPRISV